jgi:hypothetical protein
VYSKSPPKTKSVKSAKSVDENVSVASSAGFYPDDLCFLNEVGK